MKKKFDCSWYAVCKVAEEHGLELPKSNDWTNEEIKYAESLFNFGKSYKEISKIINRPECSVAKLLRELGYAFSSDIFWKDDEIDFLKQNYNEMKYKDIALELGRTEKSIAAKKKELKLTNKTLK